MSPSIAAGNPPPRSTTARSVRCRSSPARSRAVNASGASQARGSRCWLPTWKATPTGMPEIVCGVQQVGRLFAEQPNLWPSDQSAPSPLVFSRISTVEPGAKALIFASSPTLSRVNRSHPAGERVPDVGRLLDRVAVGQVRRIAAGSQHRVDLARTGDIPPTTECGKCPQDRRRRIGLDREMQVDSGQCRAQRPVTQTDHSGVHSENRCVVQWRRQSISPLIRDFRERDGRRVGLGLPHGDGRTHGSPRFSWR